MEDNNQQPNMPLLCSKGCGFFGSSTYDGLCSKCHKCMESQADKVQEKVLPSPVPVTSENEKSDSPIDPETSEEQPIAKILPKPDTSDFESDKISTADEPQKDISSDTASAVPPQSKKPNRCAFCKKRVGLTGITCHCGGLFCAAHRYSDSHNCKFDYRETGQDEIRKANPQILCSKVNKI